MPARATIRPRRSRNIPGLGWLTEKKVTYRRSAAEERKQARADLQRQRKEHLEDLRYQKEVVRLEREIAKRDQAIAKAESKIEKAGERESKGAISEAKFEQIKAHMEREIAKQEKIKSAAQQRISNPAVSASQYRLAQAVLSGTARRSGMSSTVAREIVDRTPQHLRSEYMRSNPCATTRKGSVSDRAKRYRANQPGCRPAGIKKCKLCGSRSDVMVDHVDGDESNGAKSNLRWLCRSCNTMLGAEMARSGSGRRTVQYNPGGARTLGEYMQAVLQHTRGAHDEGGRIIHETPKRKREEFASQIWSARKARGNPEDFREPSRSYRGAMIEHIPNEGYRITIPARVTRDRHPVVVTVYTLPEAKARIDREFGRANPEGNDMQSSTEFRLGYNLGQTDKNTAMLRKTTGELQAVFAANFASAPFANWEWFEDGYQAGYGSLQRSQSNPGYALYSDLTKSEAESRKRKLLSDERKLKQFGGGNYSSVEMRRTFEGPGQSSDRYSIFVEKNPHARRNPDSGDGSEEYRQAARTAELFHGRPVQEIIEVEEEIREHKWYASIGPLIKLKIKPLTTRKITPLKFHLTEKDTVQLFVSPDGLQFYLRGGDQELDVAALGMGPDTKWYRDLMVIGEAREITYRDRKKFNSFDLIDYFHKLGEETKKYPLLLFNSLSKKMMIAGGQYGVEMKDLVSGMSPGIVN